MKPPVSIVIVACVMAAICASVGWIGITENHLSTGGKLGISTFYGASAVLTGWLFIGGAFLIMGAMALHARFKNIIWLVLATIYILLLVVYWFFFYAPSR